MFDAVLLQAFFERVVPRLVDAMPAADAVDATPAVDVPSRSRTHGRPRPRLSRSHRTAMSTLPRLDSERSVPRILLVDDDEGNREVLAYFLRRRGFAVSTASSGEDALAALDGDHVRTGPARRRHAGHWADWRRCVRSARASPRSTLPVVMVTGLDAGDDVTAAIEMGANDYVTKPYQLADALTRIRTLIERASGHAPPLI